MTRELIFYSIAASVIALIAQAAGASLGVVIFSCLLIPPILLLVIRMMR